MTGWEMWCGWMTTAQAVLIAVMAIKWGAERQRHQQTRDALAALTDWARRSESDPFAARKVIHLRA